jgi:hypothetical protein
MGLARIPLIRSELRTDPTMPSIIKQIVLSSCVVFLPVSGGFAQAAVAETRNALREWVRIESEISSETHDWSAEKEILLDRIALLEAEEARLLEQIEEAESGLGEVDEKRTALNTEREAIKSVMAAIEEPLIRFEARIRELYKTFPEPLQEETHRLYDRIPEDPAATRLSVAERLQAVVGLLNFADKFNSGVQREVEIRTLDGQQVEVETLYFGLAGAFYTDAQGRHAGTGTPGPDGWQWQKTPEAAGAIARLIAVYNGTREAEFSPVPVTLP